MCVKVHNPLLHITALCSQALRSHVTIAPGDSHHKSIYVFGTRGCRHGGVCGCLHIHDHTWVWMCLCLWIVSAQYVPSHIRVSRQLLLAGDGANMLHWDPAKAREKRCLSFNPLHCSTATSQSSKYAAGCRLCHGSAVIQLHPIPCASVCGSCCAQLLGEKIVPGGRQSCPIQTVMCDWPAAQPGVKQSEVSLIQSLQSHWASCSLFLTAPVQQENRPHGQQGWKHLQQKDTCFPNCPYSRGVDWEGSSSGKGSKTLGL